MSGPGVGDRVAETDAGVLHNMSAPPRMTVAVRPLGSAPVADDRGSVALPSGLRLVARVDPVSLLGAPASRNTDDRHWLLEMTALSRRAAGSDEIVGDLRDCSEEALMDVLRTNVVLLEPPADLPCFMLARRDCGSGEPAIAATRDPARALALMSRVAGRVYVARRTPRIAALLAGRDGVLLYSTRPVGREVGSP